MSPTFLLSFDCEGKWGFADGLSSRHQSLLSHAALTDAYRRLLALLARHRIRASFAFVGALTLSPEQADAHPQWFSDDTPVRRAWLARFHEDRRRGISDGWLLPGLLALVREQPQHEIASHGFSHLPLAESLVDRHTARRELETAQAAAALHGLRLQTLVYPRNLCGYASELDDCGFLGYRQGRARPAGTTARLGHLLTECWPRLRAEAHAAPAHPLAIPAGAFLNWRHGMRRHVPPALTLGRWRHALDDALARGGVVHLYSHPHNFLDGDGQWTLLEQVLAAVAIRLRAGELANPTLADYCRQRLAGERR